MKDNKGEGAGRPGAGAVKGKPPKRTDERYEWFKNKFNIEAAIAEGRNPRLIAKDVIKGGPERVAEARSLLEARFAAGEGDLHDHELLGELGVLTNDHAVAEAAIVQLFEMGPRGRFRSQRVIGSALNAGNIDLAEKLVSHTERLAPDTREVLEIRARLTARMGDDAGAIDALAEAQERFPNSKEIVIARAKRLGRLHRWDEARAEIERFVERVGQPGGAADLLWVARTYAKLSDPETVKPRPLAGIDVRYINLDSDGDRRERIEGLFRQCGIELERTAGVRGAYLPELVRDKVAPTIPRLRAPTLGVFLSHVKTWEAVAETGRAALVLEDDAQPVFRLRSAVEQIVPKVKDLTFVNQRLCRRAAKLVPRSDGFSQVPVSRLGETLQGETAPPGGDGYILTPAGARKLLAYVAEDGCIGHVDVQMLTYGLREEHYAEGEGGRQARRLGVYWKRHQGLRDLDAHVLYPALTEARDLGESARLAEEAELD